MATNQNHSLIAALEEPVQYPGRMNTYPNQVKGQPPAFVHDCVPGCPMMPPRPVRTQKSGCDSGFFDNS